VRSDKALMTLARAIALGDEARALALLADAPELATACLENGATRHDAQKYVLDGVGHLVYAGDTALHVAAASYDARMVCELVDAGASVAATNRRGAQPLHYAVDGTPGSPHWNPGEQSRTVQCLLQLGADPNVADKNGTTPLHRAVRNRCAAAVKALLDGGSDLHVPNGSGSTAIQLARWTTGRGGSGMAAARAEQQEILRLLQPVGTGAE
jgi:Ankyrin repeats (many copies)/Ankyrin repeat